MWDSVISLLQTTLSIINQWLTWQVTIAQVNARKLVRDIDQEELAKGRALEKKIDAARTAGDLSSVSLLLDDAAANALYVADIRSSIPVLSGIDLGIGGGISEAPASGDSVDDSTEPAQKPDSGPSIAGIPSEPFCATGRSTIFGRGYRGENDRDDLEPGGEDSTGFFIDPKTNKNYATHNTELVGASLPREILLSTLLDRHDWRTTPVKQVWAKHGRNIQEIIRDKQLVLTIHDIKTRKTADSVALVDVGPSSKTGVLLDRTYGLCKLMGSNNDSHVTVWLHGPDQKPIELKGWVFDKQVVG